ncbi:ATP-binding protein [Mucilaginibacter sp. UR6-11]|uniref:ATP-binding protein n=1 Tax=Mucilaginibacter sp. UR6-11 TaxID=1435644 RepID=UPI00351D3D4E
MAPKPTRSICSALSSGRAIPARSRDGTGLGLNIVARRASLLGGKIEFKSYPGKGTTFVLLSRFNTHALTRLQALRTSQTRS